MGSFNTTCFASMQTIKPYDECYIFPIMAQHGYNVVDAFESKVNKDGVRIYYPLRGITDSNCYSNAFWQPVGGLISAVYDDYGNFVIEDTKRNKDIISEFILSYKRDFLKVVMGENTCHDLAFDPEVLNETSPIESIYAMWDAVFEYRVFVKSLFGVPVQLQFAVISKAAADYLVNYINDYVNPYTGVCNDINYRLNVLEAQFIEDLKISESLAFHKLSESVGRASESIRFNRYFSNIVDFIMYSENNTATAPFTQKIKESLCDVIKQTYVFAALERMNIKVSPMVYASQDYSNHMGSEYAKFVNSVNKTISDRIQAEDYE